MGCIYRAYVPTTGKFYIGQTKHESWRGRYKFFSKHWAKPIGSRSSSVWSRALAKYWGEDKRGVQFRDLMTNVALADLDGLERFFIKRYDSANLEKGYNIELGGNKKKTISADTRLKLSLANGSRASWYHKQHGFVFDNPKAVSIKYGVDYASLSLVKAGKNRSTRGWVCLDAPPHLGRNGRPRVWFHENFGEIVGDTRAMILRFPEHKLYAPHLTMLVKKRDRSHKGWTFVRNPTQVEERTLRLWWANHEFSDSDSRKVGSTKKSDTSI